MNLKQSIVICFFAMLPTLAFAGGFSKGDKLKTLTNLHPDMNKMVIYTMNYQLPGIIPVCSDIEVVSAKKKKMVFLWKGKEFTVIYDKHTKKGGYSFDDALAKFFGPSCDEVKINKLSKLDQKGIRKGQPIVGMTREGVYYAMGNPPPHANPDLEGYTWLYWRNRFARRAVDFDDNGIVESIR